MTGHTRIEGGMPEGAIIDRPLRCSCRRMPLSAFYPWDITGPMVHTMAGCGHFATATLGWTEQNEPTLDVEWR